MLQDFTGHLDLDSLWRTFAEERRFHVRKNVLCLLFRLPTWSRLRFIIMACVDANADIVGLACKRLQDWRQRSASSTPTSRDLQTLEGLLGKYGPRLDQDFVPEMRFWMQGFK